MTDLALKHYTPGSLPTVEAVPVTQLTPMQMAYQLVAKGADFAAVREMIEFGKKLEADEAEKAFNVAMAACQADMKVVASNQTNTQTRSRYADYAQLDKAVRPIYTRHGFALSFDEGDTDKPDHIRVLCYVTHQGGHSRTYRKDMPADGKGAKGGDVMTKTHAAGAADTYGMRYLLKKIFNIAVGEVDRDGNTVATVLSDEQVEEIKALIDQAVEARPGTSYADWTASFLEFMKAESLNTIPAKDFQKAKTNIQNAIKMGAK
jgi:hypothetical protein